MIIFYIGLIGLLLACFWKIYEKAGREGWEGIVPIYNLYVLTQIIGKPWWWTILMLIPYVNFIWIIWSYNLLAKNSERRRDSRWDWSCCRLSSSPSSLSAMPNFRERSLPTRIPTSWTPAWFDPAH